MSNKSFQVTIQAVTHHLVVHLLYLGHKMEMNFVVVVVERKRGSWFKRPRGKWRRKWRESNSL